MPGFFLFSTAASDSGVISICKKHSVMQEPYLDLKVESHFEGRDFPQLSSFIEAQVCNIIW